MSCDTRLKPRQTIQQRAEEVRRAVDRIQRGLVEGRVKAVVNAKGGIAFGGVADADRDGVTDACAYRRIMVSGSALAKAAIQRAEQLAGCSVDKRVIAQGHHSHDGGHTWHNGH